MNQYYFSIHISYLDFEQVYRGYAKQIIVTDQRGIRVQIPAQRFLPFVQESGIHGSFVLQTDSNHKFVSLLRC